MISIWPLYELHAACSPRFRQLLLAASRSEPSHTHHCVEHYIFGPLRPVLGRNRAEPGSIFGQHQPPTLANGAKLIRKVNLHLTKVVDFPQGFANPPARLHRAIDQSALP